MRARQMLAAALRAEVAAYVAAHADQLDDQGHRLVVRNGYHEPREVMTAARAVPVRAPRVNDRRVEEATGERKRFSSAILPAWSRKSPQIGEVLRPGAGTVPGQRRRAIRDHHHRADQPVAAGRSRVQ
jgi:hypothetical protein